MTDDTRIDSINSLTPSTQTNQTNNASQTQNANQSTDNAAQIDQQEFLTLLVHQLQNQDPLDPMSNEEFAVQLAQFSQLEQLIEINDKIGADESASIDSSNPVASMASYLGHEVVLKDGGFSVSGGEGSNLLVDVPGGTPSIRVDLLDAAGTLVSSETIEDIESGSQVLSLDNLDVSDGNYDVRVVAVGQDGQFTDLQSKVTGTVEGFVLEPSPALLIGGREVSLDEVLEVHRGSE